MLTWYFPKSERSQPCSRCFDQKFCLVDILCYTGWHYAGTSGAKRVQENKLAGFRNRALNSIQWGNQDVLESRQGDWRQWDIPVPCPHGRHEEGRQHGLGHASILLWVHTEVVQRERWCRLRGELWGEALPWAAWGFATWRTCVFLPPVFGVSENKEFY